MGFRVHGFWFGMLGLTRGVGTVSATKGVLRKSMPWGAMTGQGRGVEGVPESRFSWVMAFGFGARPYTT